MLRDEYGHKTIAPGSMFFALKGPNFNANDFANEALLKGARYAVVDDAAVVRGDRLLFVPHVLRALQDLARHHRHTFSIPIVAITGTNGKTTTKELAYAVLNSTYPALATVGNLNNHIGVPLTLLRLTNEHRFAIIEMGANKPGDIAELAAIAEPTQGLITNIGKAHLEGFGGFDGVLKTKTELYAHVGSTGGELFINADDEVLVGHGKGIRRVTYGTSNDADVRGTAIGSGPFLGVEFTGQGGGAYRTELQLIGTYNLHNVLAAVAIGQHFNVPDQRIAEALAGYRPGNSRSQFTDTGRNHLILDAYNANPTSMAAALENFAALTSDRPKLAILGDMLELGAHSEMEHQNVVSLVQRLKVNARYVGPQFTVAAQRSGALNWPDADQMLRDLHGAPITGHLVLLKGSRGMKLETLVPAL